MSQPIWFFKPALIRLSYPARFQQADNSSSRQEYLPTDYCLLPTVYLRAHCLFVGFFVHEEVFAPFGTRFGIVAEDYAVKPDAERVLRGE